MSCVFCCSSQLIKLRLRLYCFIVLLVCSSLFILRTSCFFVFCVFVHALKHVFYCVCLVICLLLFLCLSSVVWLSCNSRCCKYFCFVFVFVLCFAWIVTLLFLVPFLCWSWVVSCAARVNLLCCFLCLSCVVACFVLVCFVLLFHEVVLCLFVLLSCFL